MNYHKYPRTLHLPWSPGGTADDKILPSVDVFAGREVVVTEKMDGENTSLYRDHLHARSLDSKHHPSRTWIKADHSRFAHEIPEGWRICGENVYAKHSILYTALPSYFLTFAIYDQNNTCLSWDETVQYSEMLGLVTVPVLYRGVWDEQQVRACWTGVSKLGGDQEGYVVRVADSFPWVEHHLNLGKYVRQDHVQTDEHWLTQPVVPNQLRA